MKEALARFPWPWLTGVGLMIFLAFFCGVVVWVYRRRSSQLYPVMAALPLEEAKYVE